jgi:hypothetical protein
MKDTVSHQHITNFSSDFLLRNYFDGTVNMAVVTTDESLAITYFFYSETNPSVERS